MQMLVRQNNRISLSEIKNRLKEPASKATICRMIHSAGLKGYSPRKVPYVSKVNRQKHLRFYEKHAF